MKRKAVSMYFDEEVYEKFQELAKEKRSSVSRLLEIVMVELLEKEEKKCNKK